MEIPPADDLDLQTKVGQMFMIGFNGEQGEWALEPTQTLRELLVERKVGNVLYFAWNVKSREQTTALSSDLQNIAMEEGSGVPLFIMTDQEGGISNRLGWKSVPPSQMALGAAEDPKLARQTGTAVAEELQSVGINFNLTPVLDVNSDPQNPVISTRSFSDDPTRVAQMGTAIVEGMRAAGMPASAKHFPGHGDVGEDTHHSIPVVEHDRDRLDAVELAPFAKLVEHGIDTIMLAHIGFPALTGDRETPATLSKQVQTDLLRDELGFDGVIITDCLDMDAISENFDIGEAAVQAIEAGSDLITVSHNPESQTKALDAVLDAVESGRISEQRINKSVERILDCKRRSTLAVEQSTSDEQAATEEAAIETAKDVAAAGLTPVCDRDGTLPFDTTEPVELVVFDAERPSLAEDSMYNPKFVSEWLSDPLPITATQVNDESTIPDFDSGTQVLIAVYNAVDNEHQSRVVDRLDRPDLDTAVFALRNPYDLAEFPDVSTCVVSYDYTPATLCVASAYLAGERDVSGHLPVDIPVFDATTN